MNNILKNDGQSFLSSVTHPSRRTPGWWSAARPRLPRSGRSDTSRPPASGCRRSPVPRRPTSGSASLAWQTWPPSLSPPTPCTTRPGERQVFTFTVQVSSLCLHSWNSPSVVLPGDGLWDGLGADGDLDALLPLLPPRVGEDVVVLWVQLVWVVHLHGGDQVRPENLQHNKTVSHTFHWTVYGWN